MAEKSDGYQTGGREGGRLARKWQGKARQESGSFSRASCLKAAFVRDSSAVVVGAARDSAAFCLFSRAVKY